MKVFLLANSFPHEKNKASGIFNYRMVKQMRQMGQEVFVVFFRILLPGRKVISSYYYDNIKVTTVCLPLVPIDNYFFLRINNLICGFLGWKILKRELMTCDIIHSVYLTNNGVSGALWAKKLKIPHISQAIGSDVNSDMLKMAKSATFQRSIEKIDGIITNSKDLERGIKRLYSNLPEIRTIYRGVYVEELSDSISDKNWTNGVTFLFLGGLNPYKRLKYGVNTKGGVTLMKSWKMVENEMALGEAKLFFGGPYSTNNKLCDKWRFSLKYPQNVELIGEIDPSDVKKYLEKSNMVVIPSMEEGLPNFLLESYASAKPAIGSNAGGIPEVIVNLKTGFIFEKGNVDQLAQLLMQAAADRQNNKQMGERAYNRVKTYFNADSYSKDIVNFYRNLVKKCVGLQE